MGFITRNFSDWWVAHYDPFYGYVGEGVLVVVAVSVASWYFPVLRSLAGAVVFAVVAALFGFRKGEQAEQTREAAREDLKKTDTPSWWGTKG
jgi:predicted Na+-dependent transporter